MLRYPYTRTRFARQFHKMTTNLALIKEKLKQLAQAWEQDRTLVGCEIAPGQVIEVNRPLSAEQIEQLESAHQVSFPSEYRDFLRQIGDISIGPGQSYIRPGDGLSEASSRPFPLDKPFLGQCSPERSQLPEVEKWNGYHELTRQWDTIHHEDGVQAIADYGCAIRAMLILDGPFTGRVWLLSGDAAYYGPFGGWEALHEGTSPDEKPTCIPRDYSFLEWYLHWLDSQLSEIE